MPTKKQVSRKRHRRGQSTLASSRIIFQTNTSLCCMRFFTFILYFPPNDNRTATKEEQRGGTHKFSETSSTTRARRHELRLPLFVPCVCVLCFGFFVLSPVSHLVVNLGVRGELLELRYSAGGEARPLHSPLSRFELRRRPVRGAATTAPVHLRVRLCRSVRRVVPTNRPKFDGVDMCDCSEARNYACVVGVVEEICRAAETGLPSEADIYRTTAGLVWFGYACW